MRSECLWFVLIRCALFEHVKKCHWLTKCHKGEVLSSFLPHRLSLYTLRGVQLDSIWLVRTWDTLQMFWTFYDLLCAATWGNWIRRRTGKFPRIWTFCSWGMLSFVYPLGIAWDGSSLKNLVCWSDSTSCLGFGLFWRTHGWICGDTYFHYEHIHVYTYTLICIYCICMSIIVYIYINTYVYVHIYIYIIDNMFMCMCMQMYMYMHMHMCV